MMNILQFKVGGEYDYNVTFETGYEKRKIQTNDRPQGDLVAVISRVVQAALKYFRFIDIVAQFQQITFSYPEKGDDCFVIELTVKSKDNVYVKHVLKSQKLELREEDTESTDPDSAIRIKQNNTLVKEVVNLREAIVAYAHGARMQEDLPFEDVSETKKDASLFDDDEEENEDELNIVAGNITEFPK